MIGKEIARYKRYTLSAATIFLSAFLVFQIQLIFGKVLLPRLGGSSAVWATSMLFFTGMLFCGYLYAYVISLQAQRTQIRIHLTLIVLGTIWILICLIVWHSGAPPLEWIAGKDLPPAVSTLLMLLSAIGISYFLLSTTGPLIQYWYGITTQEEPYSLYAVSNVGSFLALISYPLLVEPLTTLEHQKLAWATAFLVYAALSVAVCLQVKPTSNPLENHESQPILEKFKWGLYALFPSLMLIAITTHITQVIAPIPLLWIVPLAVYLLTFIIAFAGFQTNLLVPVGLFFSAAIALRYGDTYADYLKVGADLALLFFLGLYCHSELYKGRPPREHSALFYLCVSFGGMVGAFLASIAAPLVLKDFWEFPFGCAVGIIVAFRAIALLFQKFVPKRVIELLTSLAAAGIIVYVYFYVVGRDAPCS
jgi:hypothetical protein